MWLGGPVRKIGLSYWTARLGIDYWAPQMVYKYGLWLHRLAEFIPWNPFRGPINVKNTGSVLKFQHRNPLRPDKNLLGLWGEILADSSPFNYQEMTQPYSTIFRGLIWLHKPCKLHGMDCYLRIEEIMMRQWSKPRMNDMIDNSRYEMAHLHYVTQSRILQAIHATYQRKYCIVHPSSRVVLNKE